RSSRHQRGKRRDGGLLDPIGRDDHAQHEMKLQPAQIVKNAALLSPCHIQSSLQPAVFCGRPCLDLSIDVLDLFSGRVTFQSMSRASSHALKHPPVTAPSEPAGAPPVPELQAFSELYVAIERERRRGGAAQSNASGRFEAEARIAFDDGWQSL